MTSRRLPTLLALALAAGLPGAALAQRGQDIVLGPYDCRSGSGSGGTGANLTIEGAGRYLDGEGKPGGYNFDSSTGRLRFISGGLEGRSATYKDLQTQPPTATLSFEGDGAATCSSRKQ